MATEATDVCVGIDLGTTTTILSCVLKDSGDIFTFDADKANPGPMPSAIARKVGELKWCIGQAAHKLHDEDPEAIYTQKHRKMMPGPRSTNSSPGMLVAAALWCMQSAYVAAQGSACTSTGRYADTLLPWTTLDISPAATNQECSDRLSLFPGGHAVHYDDSGSCSVLDLGITKTPYITEASCLQACAALPECLSAWSFPAGCVLSEKPASTRGAAVPGDSSVVQSCREKAPTSPPPPPPPPPPGGCDLTERYPGTVLPVEVLLETTAASAAECANLRQANPRAQAYNFDAATGVCNVLRYGLTMTATVTTEAACRQACAGMDACNSAVFLDGGYCWLSDEPAEARRLNTSGALVLACRPGPPPPSLQCTSTGRYAGSDLPYRVLDLAPAANVEECNARGRTNPEAHGSIYRVNGDCEILDLGVSATLDVSESACLQACSETPDCLSAWTFPSFGCVLSDQPSNSRRPSTTVDSVVQSCRDGVGPAIDDTGAGGGLVGPVVGPGEDPSRLGAPVIAVQPEAMVDAISEEGAVVDFAVSVATTDGSNPVPTCTPLGPGDVFPVGVTRVTCTVTDASGRVSEPTFTFVIVSGLGGPPVPDGDGDDDASSLGLILGVVAGLGLLLCCGCCLCAFFWWRKSQKDKKNKKLTDGDGVGQGPPSASVQVKVQGPAGSSAGEYLPYIPMDYTEKPFRYPSAPTCGPPSLGARSNIGPTTGSMWDDAPRLPGAQGPPPTGLPMLYEGREYGDAPIIPVIGRQPTNPALDALAHIRQAHDGVLDGWRLEPDIPEVGGQAVVVFATSEKYGKGAIKLFVDAATYQREIAVYDVLNASPASSFVLVARDNSQRERLTPTLPMPCYIVMRRGESMHKWIKACDADRDLSLWMLKGVCDQLALMHAAGFVHRDIKPPNILFLLEQKQWRLIDFGSAARTDVASEPSFTLRFAAPETLCAIRDAKRDLPAREMLLTKAYPSEDVWAVGIMAFELFSDCYFYLNHTDDDIHAMLLGSMQFPYERDDSVFLKMGRWGDMVRGMLQRDASQRPPIAQVVQILRGPDEL